METFIFILVTLTLDSKILQLLIKKNWRTKLSIENFKVYRKKIDKHAQVTKIKRQKIMLLSIMCSVWWLRVTFIKKEEANYEVA